MSAVPIYRFADCEVDPNLRQVRRDGVLLEPQPRTFDLLLYLIAHRDRVVDKAELLAKLWPGMVVSESALTQAMRKVRVLVGDDGHRQSIIRTVHRRGFRFVMPLESEPAAGADAGAANGFAAPPVHEPSVAVLPFVDLSPQRDQEYFCDGMTEEVTNALTHNPNVRVAARTSAFAFKNRKADIREVGRRLGVTTVLEGSVRKDGDKLRVTAQLVDASSGFHLWSERWDRKLEDMFAIQDEIARRIANALRMPPGQRSVPLNADELCRRGLAYMHRFGVRNQRFAMDLFKQALSTDPSHARSWAGLALSHMLAHRPTPADDRHRHEALHAAERALAIDERSAEAWTARGAAAAAVQDFAAAETAFMQALHCDPHLFEAHYHYGTACLGAGRYEQAAASFERAAELRPDDYQAPAFAAQAYRSLGRQALERQAAERALAAVRRALAVDPTDTRALSLGVCALVTVGRLEEARAWLQRACALEPDESYIHYNAACAYARLGEPDRAIAALERIAANMLCRAGWLEHDVDLETIRNHPRFRALSFVSS